MDLRQELTSEIRKARGWLIAVGIIMFAFDMIMIHGIYGDMLPGDFKTQMTVLSVGILASFLVLAYFTSKKPKLCLGLGLALFWGVQILGAVLSGDPSSLAKGIIIKIFFTMALIKGLQSASRAQTLIDDLEKVFE